MLKRPSFYVVVLFSVAMFMTSGCATRDVAMKDEGPVPATVARQAEKPKSAAAAPGQAVTPPARQVAPADTRPASAPQAPKAASASQLQSALERIYFDFDSANLSEAARRTLTKNASVLMNDSSAKIRIEGNCDERGSAEYNLALGERRAGSARQYLQSLGVKDDRLSIISYGKEKPAVQGSDESAMAKNRRDEFVVLTR